MRVVPSDPCETGEEQEGCFFFHLLNCYSYLNLQIP
jgi:hypothetical protein